VTDRVGRACRITPEIGVEASRAAGGLRIPALYLTRPENAPEHLQAGARRVTRLSALRGLIAARALLSGLLFLAAVLLATAAAPRADDVQVFVADPAASHVRIRLGRAGLFGFLGHDHLIEAPIDEGRIEVRPDAIQSSRVAFRFRAAALAVVPGTEPADDIPEVEKRMRGPEILDVARYPEIAFDSASVQGGAFAGREIDLRVRGWLTLRGRRHDVEVPVRVTIDGSSLAARGHVELRLRDLGIEPPSVARVVNVANRFGISIDVRATRAASPLPGAAREVASRAGAPTGAVAAADEPGSSRVCAGLPVRPRVRSASSTAAGLREAPRRDRIERAGRLPLEEAAKRGAS